MATKEELAGGDRKLILMPADMIARIEEYRFAARHKSEADAIRALIQAGLDKVEKAARKVAAASS